MELVGLHFKQAKVHLLAHDEMVSSLAILDS